MKKKKSLFLVVSLMVIAVAVILYNYAYQDHRDIESEAPVYTLSAVELSEAFQKEETTATQRYLNKTIEVKGIVGTSEVQTLTLEPNIFFSLSKDLIEAKPKGSVIKIKGRCIGYDSLLEEIKFDQAIIIN